MELKRWSEGKPLRAVIVGEIRPGAHGFCEARAGEKRGGRGSGELVGAEADNAAAV